MGKETLLRRVRCMYVSERALRVTPPHAKHPLHPKGLQIGTVVSRPDIPSLDFFRRETKSQIDR